MGNATGRLEFRGQSSRDFHMCGRVYVKSSVADLLENFSWAQRRQGDGIDGLVPKYNGAPSLEYPIIVAKPEFPGGMFMAARWGLIPSWVKEPKPKVMPINARAENVPTSGMFKHAYSSRRALLPIDGYFEWRAARGSKIKQPFAVAMMDGKPFALAAIWEKWRHPLSGQEIKTFCIITCPANALMAQIHDRMPVIIAPEDYQRWLGPAEDDPRDLMKQYPSDLMRMWPASTRANSPKNDDPGLFEPVPDPAD